MSRQKSIKQGSMLINSCRSTHEYCDTIVGSWMANGSTYSSAQNCSDCELSVLKRQLESPFGYSDEAAEDFVSLTSSCGATGYDFASPTPYALNATSTGAGSSASATASSSCSGFHTVEKEESCVTISEARNVSTYGLIASNALDAACNSISEGRNLCLPSTCKTYQLGLSDTCESLISSLEITMAQLLAWNPMINTGCSNLASWIGWYLCARYDNPSQHFSHNGVFNCILLFTRCVCELQLI